MDLIALDISGIVVDGSLLLAVPLAFLAGLVSFLSPCVLPLAPGYLAYVAGLTGSDLADEADVNLSEQRRLSLVTPAGSSSGDTGVTGVTGAAEEAESPAVVADDLSRGASETEVGAGAESITDAVVQSADTDCSVSGTPVGAGSDDSVVDLHGKQEPRAVPGGSPTARASSGAVAPGPSSPGGTASSPGHVSVAPDSGAPAPLGPRSTAEVVGAHRSTDADSPAGPPSTSSKLSDNRSFDGDSTGTPVAGAGRGRVLVGASLFVLGFSVVFVSYGAAFGGLGAWLFGHSRQISVVMGIIVIILGLGYVGLPALSNRMWWNADRRSHARPSRGLWGAPVLGVLFGLGWTPCIGPTLAAVQTLAFTEASAVRGAVLSLAYCFGLGLPFIGMAVGLRAVAGATDWTKTHYLAISRFGGIMLMAIGVLLVTGWWNDVVAWLQGLIPGFTAVV